RQISVGGSAGAGDAGAGTPGRGVARDSGRRRRRERARDARPDRAGAAEQHGDADSASQRDARQDDGGGDVMPRLTLGIVSYNRLHYLRALVESFLACTRDPSDQIVIVDNGSDEAGAAEYLHRLSRDGVTVVVDPGGSLPSALNLIVGQARGEYLLVMPDD